ncbi:MAG: Gfo/Idh/MocA family protein [Mangrovibacterium sp.]
MNKFLRRDFLKGIAAVPFLGYFGFAFKKNILTEQAKNRTNYLNYFGINHLSTFDYRIPNSNAKNSKPIRIGLAGHGWRGPVLLRALGYAHPSWIQKNTLNGKYNDEIALFLTQEDLNIEFTGVCDTFHPRAETAVEASVNEVHPGEKKGKRKLVKIYPTYSEMIASGEIDAVIICTPDHLHARMAAEAANAGIHIYLEKPMTHSIDEAKMLRKLIKSSGVIFQLGHENRQQMSYRIAEELIGKNVLGAISAIETFTNRNDDFGAWIRPIDKRGSLSTINWKEFLGDSPWQEFNADKYFNWQRYDEFGTGVTGSQFTHFYDCMNQILHLGIPEAVAALGGTYHFKDPRDIPDVMNAIFNFPQRGFTLTYDCTLKSNKFRPMSILGSDASMEVGNSLSIYKDSLSKRYNKIVVDPTKPIYNYFPDPHVDAVSSATAMAYIKSGFGRTLIENKIIDTTFLHMKEWIDAIRGIGSPSCNIDLGFEETVTYNLANISLKEKKMVFWDVVNEEVILT